MAEASNINTAIELVHWLQAKCIAETKPAPVAKLRCFALIDCTQIPNWAEFEQQLNALNVPKPRKLYDDLAGLEIAKTGPWLVEVSESEAALHFLAQQALAHEAFSFLIGDCSLAALDDHLRASREVEMPDGSGALFRFQDIHVTAALWPRLVPAQRRRMLGPARLWAVRGPCGEMHQIEHRQASTLSSPLRFNQATVAALDEALFPWTVADQVQEIDSTLLDGLTACARLRLLNERIARARALGLTVRADLALYCALSLQLPAGFETTSPFAAALAQARTGRISFGLALDQVGSDEWQRTEVTEMGDKP